MSDKQDKIKEIIINDEKYVLASSIKSEGPCIDTDGLQYCLIRTYSAGVHLGYVQKRDGKEVTLIKSRRLYSWQGAATLSQFAQSGPSKPKQCKMPEEVDNIILTEAIEIIQVTKEAKKIIDFVPVWRA